MKVSVLIEQELRWDELVDVQGICFQVSVTRPVHACFSPRENEPWPEVAAGLKSTETAP